MRWELTSYHSPCFNKVFQQLSQFSLTDNEGNINKIMLQNAALPKEVFIKPVILAETMSSGSKKGGRRAKQDAAQTSTQPLYSLISEKMITLTIAKTNNPTGIATDSAIQRNSKISTGRSRCSICKKCFDVWDTLQFTSFYLYYRI